MKDKYSSLLLWVKPSQRCFVEWIRIVFLYPKCIVKCLKSHLIIRSKKIILYISPTYSHSEGVGGQLHRFITAQIIAHQFKLKFLHQSFVRNFHDPNRDWDKFLGFGRGERQLHDVLKAGHLNLIYLPHFDLRYCKKLQLMLLKIIILYTRYPSDTIFICSEYSFWPPDEPKIFKYIEKVFKEKYKNQRIFFPLKSVFAKNKIKIIALIRRGEIENFKKTMKRQGLVRWVPMNWYIKVIKSVLNILNTNRYELLVFSDSSNKKAFGVFKSFSNCKVILNKNKYNHQFDLFHSITQADIMVCAMSGLSFTAGLISDGIKIVPNFGYEEVYFPKYDMWIRVDSIGKIDEDEIKKWVQKLG